jgi:hypothetical protein
MVGAFVLPRTTLGITEALTTRRRSKPLTRNGAQARVKDITELPADLPVDKS